MKKHKWSLFQINQMQKIYSASFGNTNAQKIQKLEAINQKLSIGLITFSCNKTYCEVSL